MLLLEPAGACWAAWCTRVTLKSNCSAAGSTQSANNLCTHSAVTLLAVEHWRWGQGLGEHGLPAEQQISGTQQLVSGKEEWCLQLWQGSVRVQTL